jgi:hypothetical protein
MLLSDADGLASKYGLQQIRIHEEGDSNSQALVHISRRRLQIFRNSYSKFRSRIKDRQKDTSIITKTRWAITGADGFRMLLSDLDGFIEDLYKLVPITLAAQAEMIEEDEAAMPEDLDQVKLVEEAFVLDESNRLRLRSTQPNERRAIEMSRSANLQLASSTDTRQDAQLEDVASVGSGNTTWITALSNRASSIETRSLALRDGTRNSVVSSHAARSSLDSSNTTRHSVLLSTVESVPRLEF